MELIDTYRHKGLRKQLLNELREMGIRDEKVLEAMDNIPRHYFLTSAFLEFAYDNKAFQIGAGQTISQPFTVAKQTELLGLERGMKVLEIGTGSGYQTSVLCELGAKVWSIERQRLLHDNSRIILKALGYRPNLYYGDGYKGKEAFAPFDRILVTCGAPMIPDALLLQLTIGGKLIIPVGESKTQEMLEITRTGPSDFTRTEHGNFAFVPMLNNRAR